MRIEDVVIKPHDLQISISDNRLIVHCEHFAAKIRGHSYKKRQALFNHDKDIIEKFDFSATTERGGIQFNMEFEMDHQFVDH